MNSDEDDTRADDPWDDPACPTSCAQGEGLATAHLWLPRTLVEAQLPDSRVTP